MIYNHAAKRSTSSWLYRLCRQPIPRNHGNHTIFINREMSYQNSHRLENFKSYPEIEFPMTAALCSETFLHHARIIADQHVGSSAVYYFFLVSLTQIFYSSPKRPALGPPSLLFRRYFRGKVAVAWHPLNLLPAHLIRRLWGFWCRICYIFFPLTKQGFIDTPRCCSYKWYPLTINLLFALGAGIRRSCNY